MSYNKVGGLCDRSLHQLWPSGYTRRVVHHCIVLTLNWNWMQTTAEDLSSTSAYDPEGLGGWVVPDYAYWASSARGSWTNQVQARYAYVLMPAQQSSSVPDGPLHISTSPIVNSYVLPVMKSLFHVTGSVPMDVGHLPLLARLSVSGTPCPRTCGIRGFLRTVTDSHWRLF